MVSKVSGPLDSLIEARLKRTTPTMSFVGMLNPRECFDRVHCAVIRSELDWPNEQRVTVDVLSEERLGSELDLPIAIAILVANGTLSQESVDGIAFEGELCLDGTIKYGFNGFNNLKEVVDSLS